MKMKEVFPFLSILFLLPGGDGGLNVMSNIVVVVVAAVAGAVVVVVVAAAA